LARVKNEHRCTVTARHSGTVTGIQVVAGETLKQAKPLLHILLEPIYSLNGIITGVIRGAIWDGINGLTKISKLIWKIWADWLRTGILALVFSSIN